MKKAKKFQTAMAAAIALGTVAVGLGAAPQNVAAQTVHRTAARVSLPRGVHLTVWSYWGLPEFTVVQQFAQKWAKAHGDTVTVINQSAVSGGYQFYATAARAGKGPDVAVAMPHDNLGLFREEGLIAPIPNNMINRKSYTPTEMNAVTFGGTAYAYPMSVQSTALFYNKKLIKTPPVTWAQFVKDANQHGFGFSQHNLYYDFAFISGMGGYIFGNHNGTLDPADIGLASPGAIKGFELLHAMDWSYHWMNPNTTGAISLAHFTSGKLGMMIDGPWDVSNDQKAKIDLGVAPLPKLPNGKPARPFIGVMTAMVNQRGHNIPSATALAQYLSTAPEIQFFRVNADLPALVNLQNSKEVQSNPFDAAFLKQAKVGIPMPNIPQMQAVWSAMGEIANIILGKVSPTAGAHDFVAQIKKGIQVQQG